MRGSHRSQRAPWRGEAGGRPAGPAAHVQRATPPRYARDFEHLPGPGVAKCFLCAELF
jgi:hypothetical protein